MLNNLNNQSLLQVVNSITANYNVICDTESRSQSDGSHSQLLHIELDNDEAFEGIQSTIEPELVKHLEENILATLKTHYQEPYIQTTHPNDFTQMVTGYVFEDQACIWATVQGTDTCIIITLVHYLQ